MAKRVTHRSAVEAEDRAKSGVDRVTIRKLGFKELCEDCGWGLDVEEETYASGRPPQVLTLNYGTDENGRRHTASDGTWEKAKGSPELLCPNPMHDTYKFAFSRDFAR
jgi:hypothetical protein